MPQERRAAPGLLLVGLLAGDPDLVDSAEPFRCINEQGLVELNYDFDFYTPRRASSQRGTRNLFQAFSSLFRCTPTARNMLAMFGRYHGCTRAGTMRGASKHETRVHHPSQREPRP